MVPCQSCDTSLVNYWIIVLPLHQLPPFSVAFMLLSFFNSAIFLFFSSLLNLSPSLCLLLCLSSCFIAFYVFPSSAAEGWKLTVFFVLLSTACYVLLFFIISCTSVLQSSWLIVHSICISIIFRPIRT